MQYALINTNRVGTVQRYLPSNFAATALGAFTLVFGEGVRGYTLEDYVIPRLASGLYFQVREGASVEYDEEMGIFALIDDEEPLEPPVEEVWVYTQEDWDNRVGLKTLIGCFTPPEGRDYWTVQAVREDIEAMLSQANVRYVIDPALNYQAASDTANTALGLEV